MCEFMKISRSGYYAWRKRLQKNDKDAQLKNLIILCQQEHKRAYGYRRVTRWLLRTQKMTVNHKAVLRVMSRYGLLSVIRRRKRFSRMPLAEYRYPNVLQRNFKATAPNQKWATDVTYIKTKEGFLFLSIVKDLFDNYIVSYEMSQYQDYGLVDRTLKAALAVAGKTEGLILHSDQGYQYTSCMYDTLTKQNGITPSMSRPGTPLDNACAENFFSILKCECIYREKPKTIEAAQQLVHEYIHYYNYQRIQNKTGQPPYEMRCCSVL